MALSGRRSPIQDYFQWEDNSRVEVIADLKTGEKTYFVPLKDVKNYFGANNGKNLTQILEEIFLSKQLPVDAELILRDHLAVLCVLLRIGHGSSIEDFAYYEELSDGRLPFDFAHPPLEFPTDNEDTTFLQKFCEKQWRYCVPTFDNHMLHKRFGHQRILPIIYQEPYDCGNSGVACEYIVEIYGPLNKLILVDRAEASNCSLPGAWLYVLMLDIVPNASHEYFCSEDLLNENRREILQAGSG
jgi:hypothetical protein